MAGPSDIAAETCPADPVGEGLHWFGDDHLCQYCGKLDMLRRPPSPDTRAPVAIPTRIVAKGEDSFGFWFVVEPDFGGDDA